MKKKLSAVFAALFVILCVAGAIPAMAVNDTPSSNEKSWQTTLPNNYGNGTVIENAVKVDNSYVAYVSLKTGTDRMIAWVMKNGTTRISDLYKPVKGGGYYTLSYNVSSGADKGTRIMIRACSDTITSKNCSGMVDIH